MPLKSLSLEELALLFGITFAATIAGRAIYAYLGSHNLLPRWAATGCTGTLPTFFTIDNNGFVRWKPQ